MDIASEIKALSKFFQRCVIKDKVKADAVEEQMKEEFFKIGYNRNNILNLATHSYFNDLIVKTLYSGIFVNKVYNKSINNFFKAYENVITVYKNANGVFMQIMHGKLLDSHGNIVPSTVLVDGTIIYTNPNGELIYIIEGEAYATKPYIFSKKFNSTLSISDENFQTSILLKNEIPVLTGLSFFIGMPEDYVFYKELVDAGNKDELIRTINEVYGNYRFVDKKIRDYQPDIIYALIVNALKTFEKDGVFNDPEEDEYIIDENGGVKYELSQIKGTNNFANVPVVNPNKETTLKYVGEYNPYYRRLYKDYKIPIEKSRPKDDFTILDYKLTEGITIDDAELFVKLYSKCARLFKAKYHLQGSRQSVGSYFEYCAFTIFYMTTIDFLRVKTDSRFTIDGMYDRDIINKFASYGIKGLKDIPIIYKKLILKEIHNFIKIKGSREIIEHILAIFGVSNVDLISYSIFKEYNKYDVKYYIPQYCEKMQKDDRFVFTHLVDDPKNPDPEVLIPDRGIFLIKNDDEDINNILHNILDTAKAKYPKFYKIDYDTTNAILTLSSYDDIDDSKISLEIMKASDSTEVKFELISNDIDSSSVDVNLYTSIDKDNLNSSLIKGNITKVNDGLDVLNGMDDSWKISKEELLKNEKFSGLQTKYISIGNKIDLVELSSKVSLIYYELKKIEPLFNSYKVNLHFDTYENVTNDDTSLFNIVIGLLLMNLKRYGLPSKIPKEVSDVADISLLKMETFRIRDDIDNVKYTDDKYQLIGGLSDIKKYNQYASSISNSINTNLQTYDQYFSNEIPDFIRKIQYDPILKIKFKDPGQVISDFKAGFRERFISAESINLFKGYKDYDEYLGAESPYLLEIINRSITDKKDDDLFVYLSKILSTQVSNKINWVELDGKLLADYVTDIINTFRSYLIHIMMDDNSAISYNIGEYGINSAYLYDRIKQIKSNIENKDTVRLIEVVQTILSRMSIYDSVIGEDILKSIKGVFSISDKVKLFTAYKERKSLNITDEAVLADYMTISSKIKISDVMKPFDKLTKIEKKPIK